MIIIDFPNLDSFEETDSKTFSKHYTLLQETMIYVSY